MSAIALLTGHHQYYLYTGFIDMKKSFDALCGIIRNELGRTVSNKDIFIFLNKRCTLRWSKKSGQLICLNLQINDWQKDKTDA